MWRYNFFLSDRKWDDTTGKSYYDTPAYEWVDRILGLKDVHFDTMQEPGTIDLSSALGKWNHSILGALVDVFYYFSEEEIVWECLKLSFDESDRNLTRPLLHLANHLNLFKKLDLQLCSDPEDSVDLFPGITLNNCLEAIKLNGSSISSHDLEVLNRLLQSTTSLKELGMNCKGTVDYQLLSQGFIENKTLRKIFFEFDFREIEDEEIANIITIVTPHPLIQTLVIDWYDQFGRLSSLALQQLLASTSSLCTLKISKYRMAYHEDMNLGHILQGLKANKSVKCLKLWDEFSDNFMVLSRFFDVLQASSNLEDLSLNCAEIDAEDLEKVIEMDRLPKRIRLRLSDYCFDDDVSQPMKKLLLHRHPEIVFDAGHRYHFNDGKDGLHIFNMNLHGRYLLDRDDVPLSLWPLVLEKANQNASVIYEFLKGPSFAGRQN